MSYKHKVGADMMAHIEFVNDETFPAVMVPGLRGVKITLWFRNRYCVH